MPSFDLAGWVEIPDAEQVPGGPTHRRLSATSVERQAYLSTSVDVRQVQANQTEQQARDLLGLMGAVFEGRSFDVMDGSHTYTPDWWVPASSMAVEVKGEHIHSRDSRVLFDAARHAYPGITWVWARKRTKGRKGKRWEVEFYPAKA